jgi:hypothetical protein
LRPASSLKQGATIESRGVMRASKGTGVNSSAANGGNVLPLHSALDLSIGLQLAAALSDSMRRITTCGYRSMRRSAQEAPMAREVIRRSRPPRTTSLLALALGAVAVGAVAIGALAIGRLAVGRLAIRRARFGVLEVDDLVVRKLRVIERRGSDR